MVQSIKCKHRGRKYVLDILPKEVWLDILLRLSVRCLLKVTCVSKSFKSLILNPSFACQHLNLYKQQSDSHLIILRRPNSVNPCLGKFVVRPRYDLPQKPTNYNHYLVIDVNYGSDYDYRVVDYVQGLLLMCKYEKKLPYGLKEIILRNPFIRKYLRIPLPPRFDDVPRYNLGFGYDSLSVDHKIVVILFDDSQRKTSVEVYSLRSRCWRTIGVDIIPHKCKLVGGYHSNGVLHYLYGDHNQKRDNYSRVISFDLGTELFSYGDLPDEKVNRRYRLFGLLNGSFAMFRIHNHRIYIWRMKDNHGWIKEYDMHSPLKLFDLLTKVIKRVRNVVFLEKSGELLFSVNMGVGGLFGYNIYTKKMKHHETKAVYADVFVESLMWI